MDVILIIIYYWYVMNVIFHYTKVIKTLMVYKIYIYSVERSNFVI